MKHIKTFLLTTLTVICIYIIVVLNHTLFAQIPKFQNSEIWLDNLYLVKNFINNQSTHKQRLLFVGGSNILFGFNSALIDSQTSFKPINYGTHAGLPLNFHIDTIIKNAKQGDIIFLPIEFNYYTRIEPTDDYWYIQNMLTWNTSYTKYIDTKHIILAYLKNEPVITFKTLLKSYFYAFETSQDPITTMHNIWQNPQKFIGYNYQSLNSYGDFCTQKGVVSALNHKYLDSNLTLSPFFLSEYNRLLEFAASKNIKIFLIYPVTLENPSFSLKDPQTFAKIENLKAELKKHNIEIYGDFRDFHFERKYFFDTAYHLNEEGAILRTQAFIKLLEHMQQEGLIP